MKLKIAQTSVVKRVAELYTYLQTKNNEQMGLVFGDPGLGKTASCQFLEQTYSVIYCSVLPACTPTQLVNFLLYKSCGERRRGLTGAMSALLNHLHENPQGLIFDEAERLVNRNNLLDTVRTIHDNSTVPILLVGMGKIQEKLMKERHFYDRCAGFISVQKPGLADIREAVATYTNVGFSDDLLTEIIGDPNVGHNYRRVRLSVEYITQSLEHKNVLSVSAADWNRSVLPDFARYPVSNSNVVVGDF